MSTQSAGAEHREYVDGHPVLDNPAYASLRGPHAHFAEQYGNILRYPVDVSPWIGIPPEPSAEDWDYLARLAGPGGLIPLPGVVSPLPEGWVAEEYIPGVQLVDDGVRTAPEPEAITLTADDVPEMIALVARTRPGPFLARTIEMGTYIGIRREGELIALAGERLHPPGYTEISAVCTAPEFRGQGLASRLVRAVAHEIIERGEIPFLHTSASNVNAIRLYETLGFRLRRRTSFSVGRYLRR